jgi:hypothetical protein
MGGRSRSPIIIIGFLMSTTGMSYDKALRLCRTARPVVEPNEGS